MPQGAPQYPPQNMYPPQQMYGQQWPQQPQQPVRIVDPNGTGKTLVALGSLSLICGLLIAMFLSGAVGGLLMLGGFVVFVVGRFMS